MRQKVLPRGGRLARFFAPLPGRAACVAERKHHSRKRVRHACRQPSSQPQHRRHEHQAVRLHRPFGSCAQCEMRTHRVAGQDVGARRLGRPLRPQRCEIRDPHGEILDMPGDGIDTQSAGAGLAAPVGGGDPPAPALPVNQRFQVFLVEIAAAAKEQDGSARLVLRQVDAADLVSVRCRPPAFLRVCRDRTPID